VRFTKQAKNRLKLYELTRADDRPVTVEVGRSSVA